MNFLGHDVVLATDASSLVRIGAAIPDLWPLLPRRPLPMVIVRELEASPMAAAREVGLGLASHLRADGLVARLVRALGRIPRFFRDPPVESRLAERVDAWSREIEGGFDELLGFVRAALQKERLTVRPARGAFLCRE
ncbi:MAG: hypothetical protein WCI05_17960 [Myxococcales bacterium]